MHWQKRRSWGEFAIEFVGELVSGLIELLIGLLL
jgi:hypothetical protein